MAKLSCRPGDSPLALWRPRLYITCHPKAFSKYFEDLCRLISNHRACDIYYNELPEEPLSNSDRKALLSDMNLFVVPVTIELLAKPNEAMEKDIPFARENHIPILPVLMEPGIHPAYGLPHMFGKLPFVDPTCETESYLSAAEQLALLLDGILVSNKLATVALSLPADKKSESEDPFLTGIACLAGIRRSVDTKTALKLLTRAARQGNPDAMEHLHRMYLHGIGVPADPGTALQWAAKLAACLRSQEKIDAWPDTLRFLSNLAAPLQHFDEVLFPLTLLTRLHKLSKNTLGDSHPTTLHYGRLLADRSKKSQKTDRLLDISNQLLRVSTMMNGHTDPDTLTCRFRLALAHRQDNDTEQALKLLSEVYQTLCDQEQENSPLAMATLYYIASFSNTEDQSEKALELAEKCYQLRTVNLGRTHPDTLYTLFLKSRILGAMGRLDESIPMKRMAYSRFRRHLGPEHPDTLDAGLALAVSLNSIKDYPKALIQIRRVYETYRDFYGEDHLRTTFARHMYDRIRKNAEEAGTGN